MNHALQKRVRGGSTARTLVGFSLIALLIAISGVRSDASDQSLATNMTTTSIIVADNAADSEFAEAGKALESTASVLGSSDKTASRRATENRTAVTSGVNIRPCTNLGRSVCAPVGVTNGSGVAAMRCWRDESWATGAYSSNRWFLLYLTDGREGYVHSSFVSGQYGVPNCNSLAYVRAADRALTYYQQVYANRSLADAYGTGWRPGPHGEWSGDCAKLTHSAYAYGAGVGYYLHDAIQQYYYYRNARVIYGGIPRYGAPVFYNTGDRWGHTALYIGGTTVISTQGYDHAAKPVERRDINSFRTYLGWARIG